MNILPSRAVCLVTGAVLAFTIGALSCFGEGGADYGQIEAPLRGSCMPCHNSSTIGTLVDNVVALDDSKFTAEAFPPEVFPSGLREVTVAELIEAAEPAADATLDPNMPAEKAHVLHELHELAGLLAEDVPPDYTTEAKLNAFLTAGAEGAWEGCEMGDKLDLGEQGDPEGMPPLWAKTLLGLLETEFTELAPAERQKLRDYLNAILPGGLAACKPAEGSAS